MNIRYILTGVILTAALAGGIFWVKINHPVAQVGQALSGEKAIGPADAKVQIAEYSDFQCPACAKSQTKLHELEKTYEGRIRVVFHHFPLTMHRWSPVAHQAAECANQSGKFWAYQDRLFTEQTVWSNTNDPTPFFIQYAKEVELDLDRFASCLSDKTVYDKVLEDRRRGDGLQINSTPTFFINGDRVLGPAELDIKGEALIRHALGLPELPKPAAPAVPAVPAAVQPPPGLPASASSQFGATSPAASQTAQPAPAQSAAKS